MRRCVSVYPCIPVCLRVSVCVCMCVLVCVCVCVGLRAFHRPKRQLNYGERGKPGKIGALEGPKCLAVSLRYVVLSVVLSALGALNSSCLRLELRFR